MPIFADLFCVPSMILFAWNFDPATHSDHLRQQKSNLQLLKSQPRNWLDQILARHW